MDVFKAIQTRRSIRGYKSTPIPEEKLRKVLEAARLAPSANNSQDWKFVVVRDPQKIKELAETKGSRSFIEEAPVIIVAVALKPEKLLSSDNLAYTIDLAIAVDHMTLVAVEEGLGTCWIGAFSQEKVREVLNIPESCKVVALLPLGFPSDPGRPKSRKDLKEIVSYDSF